MADISRELCILARIISRLWVYNCVVCLFCIEPLAVSCDKRYLCICMLRRVAEVFILDFLLHIAMYLLLHIAVYLLLHIAVYLLLHIAVY